MMCSAYRAAMHPPLIDQLLGQAGLRPDMAPHDRLGAFDGLPHITFPGAKAQLTARDIYHHLGPWQETEGAAEFSGAHDPSSFGDFAPVDCHRYRRLSHLWKMSRHARYGNQGDPLQRPRHQCAAPRPAITRFAANPAP